MDGVQKQPWIQRVEATQSYHKECLRKNPNHRLSDTALLLKRSLGRISEDLMIADWLITHRKQIERCSTIKDALEFIRMKKLERKIG